MRSTEDPRGDGLAGGRRRPRGDQILNLEQNQVGHPLRHRRPTRVAEGIWVGGISPQPDVAFVSVVTFRCDPEAGVAIEVGPVRLLADDVAKKGCRIIHDAHGLKQETPPNRSRLVDVERAIENF